MQDRRNLAAFGFLAPNGVGFLVFTFIPVVAAFALSLFQWDIFNPPKFVGFTNFTDLLGWNYADGAFAWNDPLFWRCLGNTLFMMMGIPVSMAAALFLAIVLNQKLRGRVFFRTIFFLPHICAGVGLYLLWKYLYNPDFGMANKFLALFGIGGPDWLDSYHWAKPALMIMNVWAEMGGLSMIIYLAGLQGIPPDLYEAADIDGAGKWAQFRHITWPMLAPTTFFILVTSMIVGFQSGFNAAYIMTQGGPNYATTTIDYFIYIQAFQYFNMGYAAAISVVLFGLIFAVTLVNWRFGGRTVNYG